jgi:hypothetical protein
MFLGAAGTLEASEDVAFPIAAAQGQPDQYGKSNYEQGSRRNEEKQ